MSVLCQGWASADGAQQQLLLTLSASRCCLLQKLAGSSPEGAHRLAALPYVQLSTTHPVSSSSRKEDTGNGLPKSFPVVAAVTCQPRSRNRAPRCAACRA
jgi:hypothetical protein